MIVTINGKELTIEKLVAVARNNVQVKLSEGSIARINKCRELVENKISAGEVVENPASVVKELIENSIDSKANEIEVLIRGGGLQSIIINDNGKGISEKELPIAILRYATSKLDKDNLNEIKNFGFRGEALPAISSISKLWTQYINNKISSLLLEQ